MGNVVGIKRLYKIRIYKAVFSTLLLIGLVLVVPAGAHKVFAAPLEDCDLDGYDDATGVPVPWPGYDETKGDTPDGPAGSKTSAESTTPAATPSTTPAATNDTKDSSSAGGTGGKAGSGDSKSTNSTKADKNGKSQSSKDETKSTASAGSGKNTTKATEKVTGKSDSVSQGTSDKPETDKKPSSALSSTQKEEQNRNSGIENTNSSATSGETKDSRSNSAVGAAGDNSKIENSVSDANNNQEVISQSTEEQSQETADSSTVNPGAAADEIEEAVNTKGSLDITEAAGSIIHAGSSVIISGSGFYKDLKNLEIVIQSESRQLGIVESSQDGSFEAQVDIPKDLSEGTHHIVVLYQGNEITRQEITIGPKAADSFWQALTVGFTGGNQGLIPGILILSGLFVVGAAVLGGNAISIAIRRKS